MWEEILKRGSNFRKLNYNFLKETVLAKGREMKGEILSADEYLQIQEEIRQIYSKKHKSIILDRIKRAITKILKENNLLEVKKIDKTIYDSKGNALGYRRENVYYFI